MRTTLSVFILSLFIATGHGQAIKYERTLSEALVKAADQKKLVFMAVNMPPNPARPLTNGLDEPEVASMYNVAFVNYKVLFNDTAYARLRKKYASNIYPAYFFLDGYGNIIYKDARSSTNGQKYLNMADSALKQAKSGNTLTNYELRYKSGNIDAEFLKEYILARQHLGMLDNATLLEQYADHLPDKKLTYQDVLFIFKAGPIVYGKAYSLAYSKDNRKLVDSISKTEPKEVRSAMNGLMRTNTYTVAVETRDALLAQRLSAFISNIYRSYGTRTVQRESAQNMVSYYHAVKDTGNYLRQATWFYDNYYMNISADSAKHLIEVQRKNMKDAISKNVPTGARMPGTETFTAVNVPWSIATYLNNAAYNVYLTGTNNHVYLDKAIGWSKRSIELDPLFSNYDTLAHLQYRDGLYDDAVNNQQKAVELVKRTNSEMNIKRMMEELNKMKKRAL